MNLLFLFQSGPMEDELEGWKARLTSRYSTLRESLKEQKAASFPRERVC
jgi:hypothetical protein